MDAIGPKGQRLLFGTVVQGLWIPALVSEQSVVRFQTASDTENLHGDFAANQPIRSGWETSSVSRAREGWLHMAVLVALYSHPIVGWAWHG